MSARTLQTAAALAIIILIGTVYWPLRHAGFVWDDVQCFHDTAWLRVGDDWKHFVWRGFCDWTNYFRPLPVALFTLQLRAFDGNPAPMHMVSLAMHLGNTLLVAALALRFSRQSNNFAVWPVAAVTACIFGLHPALVEPIVWVNTQTELLVTLFMLAGLLANATIAKTRLRAVAVAACFFLAACSKESAAAFPLLLLLFDWLLDRDASFTTLWHKQRAVYAAVLLAGLGYIALRMWAFGYVVQPTPAAYAAPLAHAREVAFIYATYWRILLWPMFDTGPVHPFDLGRFAVWSAASALALAGTLTLIACGLWGMWRRSLLGGIVVGATVALLPVLHIIPVAFDPSLYHERYVMMPLALLCALLPAAIAANDRWRRKIPLRAFGFAALVWLAMAAANVSVTLPLWSDEITLWTWALRNHPDSLIAQDRLLAAYMDAGDGVRARELANVLLAGNTRCPFCALNAAYLGIEDGNLEQATTILESIRRDPTLLAYNRRFTQRFIQVSGMLREAEHDPRGAEEAYRDAVTVDPLTPEPQMALALFLAHQGREGEARTAAERAEQLYAPDVRNQRRQEFEQALARRTAVSE